MTNRWRIEMLGRFRVAHTEHADFRFATRKTAALLACLAFYPGKSWSRESLADQFWPEHEPEPARNSLRVALNALRKLFEAYDKNVSDGDALLVTDRSSVRLNPRAFSTDVMDFENALRAEQSTTDPAERLAALLGAVEVYRGPLLPGWYEEWIGGEQTRLAEASTSALRRLTNIFTEAKDFERAFLFARRAVQDDPLREESHRLLVHLHALTGNTTAALAQYRELENRLREELGTTPSRVTRELMRQILSADRTEPVATKPAGDSLPSAPLHPAPNRIPSEATPRREDMPPAPPRPLTRFFGRDAEMNRLLALLAPNSPGSCRLVTITGIGGTGKTRLALEVAHRCVPRVTAESQSEAGFSGGVWVVSLAEVARPAGLAAAVAATFTSRLSAGGGNADTATEAGAWEQILTVLQPPGKTPKPTLLVLDNFERLLEGASWVADLMQAVPALSCLITSRQRLGIGGEQEISLGPLLVPPAAYTRFRAEPVSLEHLEAYPSVRLWIDRARTVRPDFQLTERNASAVANLVARLDGLPLALELSAAWARLLTPTQMVERLQSRFDLLVAAGRDIAPRHRSLRAVLEETTNLLSPSARAIFSALSVFRGGWTLDAAQMVCAQDGALEVPGAAEILEVVAQLQESSLISAMDGIRQVRFSMLETVREYAAKQLAEEEDARLRGRHARYFAALASDAAPHLNRVNAPLWLSLLEEDQDNLGAVLDCVGTPPGAVPEADLPPALPLGAALWRYWYARGRAEQGAGFLERYLGDDAALPVLQAAHEGAGRLALALGQASQACRILQAGLEKTAAQPGAAQGRALARMATNLALAARAAGDEQEACRAYEIIADEKKKQGDLWAAACALLEVGTRRCYLQDDAGAKMVSAEGRHICVLLGDEWGAREGYEDSEVKEAATRYDALAHSYLTLGHVACEQEDFTVALTLFEEARAGFLQSGSVGLTLCLERIGVAALGAGDLPLARRALEDARARRVFAHPNPEPILKSHFTWLDELLCRAA